MKQANLFDQEFEQNDSENILNPQGYKGIYGFHKYWGKKPMETYAFLVNKLSKPDEIICDPFLGYGISALESISQGRKFIGIDLNPISIRLTKLICHPPNIEEFLSDFDKVKYFAQKKINQTYRLTACDEPASHYLWDEKELISVWIKNKSNKRIKIEPSSDDLKLTNKYKNFCPKKLKTGKFFENSRINSKEFMSVQDLFS